MDELRYWPEPRTTRKMRHVPTCSALEHGNEIGYRCFILISYMQSVFVSVHSRRRTDCREQSIHKRLLVLGSCKIGCTVRFHLKASLALRLRYHPSNPFE